MSRARFRGPRSLSPRQLRWMLNLYPPFLAQGIRVARVSPDFLEVRMRVRRSLLSRNLNGTTFGGALSAACDPVFPIQYWQALGRRGLEVEAWLMAMEIRFRKPARTAVEGSFVLTEADLDAAAAELAGRGKAVRTHRVGLVDRDGDVCAEAELVSYLRPAPGESRGGSAF
jgi:acyl-coenzyme A thioesterase PaaI-like protein